MDSPWHLEGIINTLLEEMCLSSFKIEGKGSLTMVVLRLSPTGPSYLPQATHNSVYHRKYPSQVARDRRRAEVHKHRATQEYTASPSSSPSALFLPTPPSLFYSEDNATAMDTFHGLYTSPCCVGECARANIQHTDSMNTYLTPMHSTWRCNTAVT
eukprot:TRINITY_DN3523_c0_g1_i1.p1 TRINITY_DN3523_c0_g1~~TRINITY_DN3523_c0_g1_i1.p1  ORF type:complete len:156 (+),score=15.13 TRINITY_DN3523_c0_g1_i1:28-495(+)